MESTKSQFLDALDAELEAGTPTTRDRPRRRTRRFFGPMAAGALLAGAVVVQIPAAPPAAAAAGCAAPDFVNRSHDKFCGISLQRFTYKRSTWSAGTQCYIFDHNTMVCGPLNWQYAGQKSACRKYY